MQSEGFATMIATGTVRVYGFHVFEPSFESPSVAPYKATRAAIEGSLAGEVIEGTGEDVDPDELDDHGRFVRRPTGWGAL